MQFYSGPMGGWGEGRHIHHPAFLFLWSESPHCALKQQPSHKTPACYFGIRFPIIYLIPSEARRPSPSLESLFSPWVTVHRHRPFITSAAISYRVVGCFSLGAEFRHIITALGCTEKWILRILPIINIILDPRRPTTTSTITPVILVLL